MKRTPKKPPKPATAADLKADERQRMISSDLEQIRRYIGEIARLMASYRAENVALRADNVHLSAYVAQLKGALHRVPILAPQMAWPNQPPLVRSQAPTLRPESFAAELPDDN